MLYLYVWAKKKRNLVSKGSQNKIKIYMSIIFQPKCLHKIIYFNGHFIFWEIKLDILMGAFIYLFIYLFEKMKKKDQIKLANHPSFFKENLKKK